MFSTPILFLVFNRPDVTVKVFAQIRKVKPAELYIAADGPRADQPGEADLCQHVREVVLSAIDWKCEVKTLFREQNVGCKEAVSSAINWFFSEVEMGIILEDDCYPDESFFSFCEAMLHRYKDNPKVISVSGTNLGFWPGGQESYGFSRILNVWGWATWRRSASLIDYNMNGWSSVRFKNLFLLWKTRKRLQPDVNWAKLLRYYFDLVRANSIDTWDYQWIYTQLYFGSLSVFPAKNIVKNIGFAENATHTTYPNHPIAKLSLESIELPFVHPKNCKADFNFEEHQKKTWFENNSQSVWEAIKTRLLHYGWINRMNHQVKQVFKSSF